MDSKYVVFKREEWEREAAGHFPEPVPDAVVIRRQDAFAPPALDAYANSMLTVVETMVEIVKGLPEGEARTRLQTQIDALNETSHYFHEQAVASWEQDDRKLPD